MAKAVGDAKRAAAGSGWTAGGWVAENDGMATAEPAASQATSPALSRAPGRAASLGGGIPRGLGLFFGGFALLNLLGELRSPHFDANLWWIDLRPMSPAVAATLLAASGVAMILFGVCPRMSRWRQCVTAGLIAALVGIALANAIEYVRLVRSGGIRSGAELPMSLLVALALLIVVRRVLRCPKPMRGRCGLEAVVIAATVMSCGLLFPLGQMWCFGKTDYRRPATAAVVFGARAYADGSCSVALSDRVTTACDLYRDGLVGMLVFSGGLGDGELSEPQAMRRLAMQMKVPADAILLDEQGLNTDATVENTARMFQEEEMVRVLAVSHFYHLPRVKLRYQREGVEVYTVPAVETYTLTQMPYLVLREVAALWVYYLRPLVG